ncbi:blue copper protein 1b-like [Corylus avellana]|uniref:blue copper protein 1b-like n=1 Tax=Corylus avellana TaxID=13451 RepID=UPI001E1F90BE|nr:blue copper protein 1b-like [Corylus avellana]XP_059436105.1 blue copper protein 1b-like [Corylus avellana]
MGGFSFARCLILIVAASTLAVCMANKDWQSGSYQYPKYTQAPNKIIVGGSEGWHFNFSYTDWALKNGPFYLNDTLVFKYDPPTENTTIPHSVYLLPNLRSFVTCNLTGAEMLADVTQGGGQGFEFVLKKWKPHYFACGQHDGIHCSLGQMKFFVMPMLRWY